MRAKLLDLNFTTREGIPAHCDATRCSAGVPQGTRLTATGLDNDTRDGPTRFRVPDSPCSRIRNLLHTHYPRHAMASWLMGVLDASRAAQPSGMRGHGAHGLWGAMLMMIHTKSGANYTARWAVRHALIFGSGPMAN